MARARTGGYAICSWAFVRHLAFIRNVEVPLRAMAAGELNPMDQAVMEETREQFEGGSAQAGAHVRHPEWPALRRKIDRIVPTGKNDCLRSGIIRGRKAIGREIFERLL